MALGWSPAGLNGDWKSKSGIYLSAFSIALSNAFGNIPAKERTPWQKAKGQKKNGNESFQITLAHAVARCFEFGRVGQAMIVRAADTTIYRLLFVAHSELF